MARTSTYYSAAVACNLCGVTPRMLDYWITTAVVEPSRVFECAKEHPHTGRRKAYHLFAFEALVQIKIVKELRDAGLSLQSIRYALRKLCRKHGKAWQASWIVTDGKNILLHNDNPDSMESLAKGETGQLVFSVIALGATKQVIRAALDCKPAKYLPFSADRYEGKTKKWGERTICA